MVASAVLCAAVGTGMTLFVGITVVVYRYYSLRRQVHEWGSLDKMPFLDNSPHKKGKKTLYTISQKVMLLFIQILPILLLTTKKLNYFNQS